MSESVTSSALPSAASADQPESNITQQITSNSSNTPPSSPWDHLFAENMWNIDLWLRTYEEVKSKGDSSLLVTFYERFLWQFPTSAKYWISYLELEISQANYSKVNELFARCLGTTIDIDLWKFYLSYIKRLNPNAGEEHARQTLTQAYEYALQHVGMDYQSTQIWQDYIDFVKNWPANNPFEQGLRMDALRKIYARAISIPISNIESIWRDYDAFENAINKVTAKKAISEKSPLYMSARSAMRDLQQFNDVLSFDPLPVPPSWNEKEKKNLRYWRKWLEWEKSNPLQYPDENSTKSRVMYAYRKAMNNLRFYSEIWCEAAMFLIKFKDYGEIEIILKKALEIIPDSLLLTFYSSEIDESQKKIDNGKQKFEALISELQRQMEIIEPYVQLLKKFDEERKMKEAKSKAMATDEENNETENEDAEDGNEDNEQKNEILKSKSQELERIKHLANLTWIQYMKFCRRTEGMKSARQIFSRARKTDYCSCHVFVASARLEFHCNKDKQVAFKIFEVGLKMFGQDPQYIEAYIDFLISTTDDSNVRSLFERTITTMEPQMAQGIWKKFLHFENEFGDLAAIRDLEKRYNEVYSQDQWSAADIAGRYTFMGLDDILEKELGKRHKTHVNADFQNQDKTHGKSQKNAPDLIVLPTTKEEEFLFDTKKRALYTVGKGKYSKPDLSQLKIFVPDPEIGLEIEIKRQERKKNHRKREPSPTGSVQSFGSQAPVSQQPPPIAAPPPADFGGRPPPLHPILVHFFNQLPPPHVYNGPIISVEAVLELIAQTQFMPPPGYQPPIIYPMEHGPPPVSSSTSRSSRPSKRRR